MAFIFKLLPHSDLTSIETLPIMTVDWLGGGRPGGEGEREEKRRMQGEREGTRGKVGKREGGERELQTTI